MFVFRADGNQKIGMGHLMRCLSIADAARAAGHLCLFVLADHTMCFLVEERGYETRVLDTDYRDMESEVERLTEIIRQLPFTESGQNWMLVDSYQMTGAYLEQCRLISENLKIAVLDDMFLMDYPADCVINYNIYGEAYPFHRKDQLQLLGCQYVPLRQQFLTARKNANIQKWSDSNKASVLVSTGGSDSLHIAEAIIEACMQHDWEMRGIQIPCLHVVCGAMNQNKDALLALEKKYGEHVKIHVAVSDMAGLMGKCDVAITAAGSTIYELAAMGIPFVVYYFVENQRRIAEHCGKNLGICNAGDISIQPKQVLHSLLEETEQLLTEPDMREQRKLQLQQQVDGLGAERIIKKLEGISAT